MHLFDQATCFSPAGDLEYRGEISDQCCINQVPNGGYLLAVLTRAMLAASGHRATPLVTANFLSRAKPGPATVRLEHLARSTQFDRWQAGLWQGGRETMRAWGTFAAGPAGDGFQRTEAGPPQLAGREECLTLPSMPGYTFLDQVEARLDPACAGWMNGRLGDRSEHKGWLKFRAARPWDAPAVVAAADAFPPPIFASLGMVAWVPTLEFSVSLRALPASEWLMCSFRTRFVTNGLLEEDGRLWDETGGLVAISRQTAQYRRL